MRTQAERAYRRTLRAIARNLTRMRTERRLTQEVLADRAGLHGRHVQKIEAGEVNVTLWTLARLADALSATVPQLLHRERAAQGRPA